MNIMDDMPSIEESVRPIKFYEFPLSAQSQLTPEDWNYMGWNMLAATLHFTAVILITIS